MMLLMSATLKKYEVWFINNYYIIY